MTWRRTVTPAIREITRMNAVASPGSQTVRPLRNRKVLLRTALSLAVAGAICIASNHTASAQNPPENDDSLPGVVNPTTPGALAHANQVVRPVPNLTNTITRPSASSEDGPGAGAIGPGPGCNVFPAPSSVGTTVPQPPPPSVFNRHLVGPAQLLESGQVNTANGWITLPLYKGKLKDGRTVWYILTDVSDPRVAELVGLNFSAKMRFINNLGGVAARTGTLDNDGNITFDAGTVDFSPARSVTAGPAGAEFPPTAFTAGEVGDANYSPFVQITNAGGVIYDAPTIAFNVSADQIDFPNGNVDYTKVHDQVLAIDPIKMTVTLNVANGFSFGRPVWYLTTDSSIPLVAAIQHATVAPLMGGLVLGKDDAFGSGIERIFIATNGPEEGGCDNGLRQGLSAELADEHSSNNVLGGIPLIALDYSPAWDAQLFQWTTDAINNGFRGQLREEFNVLTFAQDGLITGAGGAAFGSSGFTINCPIVIRLN